MALTASKLRENIYRILDRILATGVPLEIERKGRLLRIAPVEPPEGSKLENLQEHPEAILCDPEELVQMDWSGEWRP